MLLILQAFVSKADADLIFKTGESDAPGKFTDYIRVFYDCSSKSPSEILLLSDSLFGRLSDGYTIVKEEETKCRTWLKFKIHNNTSALKSLAFIIRPETKYILYKIENNKPIPFDILNKDKKFRLMYLPPGDTSLFYAELIIDSKFDIHYFQPIIKDVAEEIDSYSLFSLVGVRSSFFYFCVIFLGMAAMMAIYLLINFFQLRDYTYLFYSINVFCIVEIVHVRLLNIVNTEILWLNLQVLLLPVLQMTSHLFYFLFAMHFLKLKELLPRLNYFFKRLVVFIAIYIVADIGIYLHGYHTELRMLLFLWARIILIAIALFSIIYAWQKPTILLRLFAIGTFLMVVSATVSMILSSVDFHLKPGFWSTPLLYFLLGYLVDIIFFTICLGYRNRTEQKNKLKLERELLLQQSLERENRLQLVLQTQEEERSRMASDLHDELGAGLSTIRFITETLKLKDGKAETSDLSLLSAKSAELIQNMRQVIWANNPEYDNLNDLVLFLKKYSSDYLDGNRIEWQFNIPETTPQISLSANVRRNLLFVFKEALHNIIKHAQARYVKIDFSYVLLNDNDLSCTLRIADDGKGMDMDMVSLRTAGNGLKNINNRMKSIGGTAIIESNEGVVLKLLFNISQ